MEVTIKIERLNALLKAVLPHASGDDTRPHLHGVLFEIEGSLLRAVATDGHTLCEAQVPTIEAAGDGAYFLRLGPAEALERATRHKKADGDSPIRFWLGAGAGELCAGPVTVWMAEGAQVTEQRHDAEVIFPPWRRVVPKVGVERADERFKCTATGLYGVNPSLLAKACVSCETLVKGYVKPGTFWGVKITTPATSISPLRIDCEHPDAGRLTCVVMPCRL